MNPALLLALETANNIAKIILIALESQPQEVRAQFWRNHAEDVARARTMFDKIAKFFDGDGRDGRTP